MARSRFVWRFCLWWCLLLCVLPTVEAATKRVTLPSLSDQVSKGSASIADSVLTMSTAIEGEFIPAATKNVPVRGILGGTTFGLNTIVPKATSLLKGGLATVAVGLAFDQLIKGVGWVMEDGQLVKPTEGLPAKTSHPNGEYTWYGYNTEFYSTPSEACEGRGKALYSGNPKFVSVTTQLNGSSTVATCTPTVQFSPTDISETSQYTVSRDGDHCPAGSSFDTSKASCIAAAGKAPVVEADYIKAEDFIRAQDSDFVKELLRQSCEGSNNPEGCYQSLRKQQLDLRGPKSVDAGSSTKTTTHPNTDGTTSTTVTTTNTKYNIVYGPTNYNYTKNTTSTTSTDGKPGDTTSEEEQPADDPADEEEDTPDDDVTASPCVGVQCDGPKYETLYKPTTDTKEQALDSYANRVKSLPLFSAVTGFFTVNASAGCPAWSTNVDFAVIGSSFHTDLVFDFHCQPWFVSIAQYAKIVMSIVCAYLAFRQAILD